MLTLSIALLFLLGVAFGSFLNVVVLRTHRQEALTGRSRCLHCEEPLGWRDLIPVLSFVLLRGRCRECKAAISWQYPLVEATLGAIFAVSWLMHASGAMAGAAALGPAIALVARDALFGAILLILFVYDLKYQLLPDRFTLPGIALALAVNLALGVAAPTLLYGMLIGGGLFLAQYALSGGKWIGGGDIRMGVLMGAMLGFERTIVALFLAYIIGAGVALILMARKKMDMKSRVPFGTFLAYATLISLFGGELAFDWYVGMLF